MSAGTLEAPTGTPAAPKRKVKERSRAGWFTRTSLALIVFLWVVPTIGVIVTSFRNKDDVAANGWWNLFLHPSTISDLTLENYRNAFSIPSIDLGQGFINSVAIALPATFIPILIAAFAAYAFTFMEFWGRDVLFILVVSLLVVPNYVAFVPILKIYRTLNVGGTFPAVWLAHVGFGMSLAIFILRNYMATLPKSVIESAKIDGASHYQTFYRLVLPMSVPALASFAIFQFLWVWNDLLVALVIIGPTDKGPVTVAISQMLGQVGQGQELVTSAGIISMLIPILVFLGLQRFFVRGLTAGAVKG